MLRTCLSGAIALIFCAGALLADEIKGKVKSVDAEKNTITVSVGDDDQTLAVAKNAKIVSLVGKGKKGTLQDVSGGLGGVKVGADVTLTTAKKDDKDTVTQVKVEGTTKKKKDK